MPISNQKSPTVARRSRNAVAIVVFPALDVPLRTTTLPASATANSARSANVTPPHLAARDRQAQRGHMRATRSRRLAANVAAGASWLQPCPQNNRSNDKPDSAKRDNEARCSGQEYQQASRNAIRCSRRGFQASESPENSR